MPKISIIIPVYNGEKQIEKCLDSCLEQLEKEIEIIVINDGSIDKSEEVIKKYIECKGTNLISFYSKKNEGVAKTRNFGIEKSKGKYIFFVDCDDYIDSRTLEKLKKYYDNDVDLIKFKLQRINDKEEIIEKVDGPTFENITGEDAFNLLYCQDKLLDSPCVYLIKKELFVKNNFKFQRTYHEDFGLIPLLILSSKSVVSVSNYFYQYFQGTNSITRNDDYKKTIQKMEDVLYHYDNMLLKIENMQLNEKTKENVRIFYTNAILLKLRELNKEDQKKYIKKIKKRKMINNIKARNFLQVIKKIILIVDIRLYLKIKSI